MGSFSKILREGVVFHVKCMALLANRHWQWRVCWASLTWQGKRQYHWRFHRSLRWRVCAWLWKPLVWLAGWLCRVLSRSLGGAATLWCRLQAQQKIASHGGDLLCSNFFFFPIKQCRRSLVALFLNLHCIASSFSSLCCLLPPVNSYYFVAKGCVIGKYIVNWKP